MNQAEILEKLRQTMKKSSPNGTNWETVTLDTTIESLGFDSLSILDLIYDIQQDFGLDFDPTELASVRTVGALVGFLKEKGA